MAPLFSKTDSKKLLHDVLTEVAVIYTKFGKDLFNISKVVSRKPNGCDKDDAIPKAYDAGTCYTLVIKLKLFAGVEWNRLEVTTTSQCNHCCTKPEDIDVMTTAAETWENVDVKMTM